MPLNDLRGKVIGVSDGDTIKILVDKKQVTVRLEGIDSPESKQSFGNRSKQALKAKACRWYFPTHPFSPAPDRTPSAPLRLTNRPTVPPIWGRLPQDQSPIAKRRGPTHANWENVLFDLGKDSSRLGLLFPHVTDALKFALYYPEFDFTYPSLEQTISS